VLRHSLLTLTFEQNLTRRRRAALQLLILLDLEASAVTSEGGTESAPAHCGADAHGGMRSSTTCAATVGQRASLLSALTGYPAASCKERFGWLLPLITLGSQT
jgi:hypothetical protein